MQRTMIKKPLLISTTIAVCMAAMLLAGAQQHTGVDSSHPRTVLDFGATGDGQTDDTAAIQRAVDAGMGQVVFPHGTYRLTRTVTIDLDRVGFTSIAGGGTARVVMAGPGPAFHFIGTHEGTAGPSTFKPNVWDRQRMPSVDAIEIVGDHAQAEGIEATGTMQLTVTRLLVRKALHGVHLSKRNRNVTLSECHIYENRGIGVFYDDVDLHQSNLTNCHISYNDQGGVVIRGGNVRNVHIGTCDIESNMGADQPPTANVLIEGAGGSTAEVAITGCTLQHNHDAPGSANIRIIGQGPKRPYTDELRDGNVTIANNVLSDVHTNIELLHTRGVVITGNTLWKAFAHQILVRDSADVVIGPNVLHDNPRYNYGDQAHARLAVEFDDCQDCTISGLHIHGVYGQPAGMVVRNARRFNINGCTILDCDGAGLLLENAVDSRVSNCLIRDDRGGTADHTAIRVVGGARNEIEQ